MDHTTVLQPLVDAPLPPRALPAATAGRRASGPDRSGREGVRAFALGLTGADEFGYTTWGELVDTVAEAWGERADFLQENPWRMASLLEHSGIGAAPAPGLDRFRLRRDAPAVVYDVFYAVPSVRRRPYRKAMLLAKFVTLAFPGLTPAELAEIDLMLGEWGPGPRYIDPVRAMLRWYTRRRRQLDKRTRLEAETLLRDDHDRAMMARQLVAVAAGRGLSLAPKSVWQLDRLLQLLGHAPGEVHSMLHRSRCGALTLPENSEGSVTALVAAGDADLPINREALRLTEQSTHKVQALLAEVFAADDGDVGDEPAAAAAPEAGHAALWRLLAGRDEWPLAEAEALASAHGQALMPALEALNDHAVERLGDTVADLEGEILYIDSVNLNQLLEDESCNSQHKAP